MVFCLLAPSTNAALSCTVQRTASVVNLATLGDFCFVFLVDNGRGGHLDLVLLYNTPVVFAARGNQRLTLYTI